MEIRNWLSGYRAYFKYMMALGVLIITTSAIYLIFYLHEADQRIDDFSIKIENLLEETVVLNEKLGNVTSYLAFKQGMLQKTIEANNMRKGSEQIRYLHHIDSLRKEIANAKPVLSATEAQIQKSVQVVNEAREQLATLQSDRGRAIAYGKIFFIVGLIVSLVGIAAAAFPKPKSNVDIQGTP